MKQYITTQKPVLYAGVHQAESWAVAKPNDAKLVDADGAEFGKAVEITQADVTAYGTDIILRWKSDGLLSITDESNNLTFVADTSQETATIGYGQYFPLLGRYLPITWEPTGVLNDISQDGGWNTAIVAQSMFPQNFNFKISAIVASDFHALSRSAGQEFKTTDFTLDSITVLDRTVQNILPISASLVGVLIITLYVILSAWRERRK